MNSQTQSSGLSVGVAIITHKAKTHLPYCLPLVLASSLAPRVLVVNSSSNDGTVELAKDMGAEVLVIARKEFNHGLTREGARKELAASMGRAALNQARRRQADAMAREYLSAHESLR
jgi:hypothetical protein